MMKTSTSGLATNVLMIEIVAWYGEASWYLLPRGCCINLVISYKEFDQCIFNLNKRSENWPLFNFEAILCLNCNCYRLHLFFFFFFFFFPTTSILLPSEFQFLIFFLALLNLWRYTLLGVTSEQKPSINDKSRCKWDPYYLSVCTVKKCYWVFLMLKRFS